MTIERKVVVDRVELTRAGATNVCLAVLLVEDDVEIDTKYHRFVIVPGSTGFDAVAPVNDHLADLGWPLVSVEDQVWIDGVHAQHRT